MNDEEILITIEETEEEYGSLNGDIKSTDSEESEISESEECVS